MKRIFIILLALATTLPVMAQSVEENYVQVNGSAEVEVVPNEFYLTIVLDESDTKGRQEIELQRRQMISALKSLGMDTEKQLTMENLSSSYFRRGTSLAVAKYQLQLSTSEQVVAVYDKLGDMGISDITISRVSHTDIDKYKSQCRKEAMVNAKQVATELAEAVGQSVGSCIYIYDSNRNIPLSYNNDGVMVSYTKSRNAAAPEAEQPVEFKKIKLSYYITAKFQLNK